MSNVKIELDIDWRPMDSMAGFPHIWDFELEKYCDFEIFPGVTRDHRNWHHSPACLQFPIVAVSEMYRFEIFANCKLPWPWNPGQGSQEKLHHSYHHISIQSIGLSIQWLRINFGVKQFQSYNLIYPASGL